MPPSGWIFCRTGHSPTGPRRSHAAQPGAVPWHRRLVGSSSCAFPTFCVTHPHVDFAAHVSGRESEVYSIAIAAANGVWSDLVSELPLGAVLVGTAHHAHMDIKEQNKAHPSKQQKQDRILYGDARTLFVRGGVASLTANLPADSVPFEDVSDLSGHGPCHETFEERPPDGILFAHDGYAIFLRRSNDRLVGHHARLTD